MPKLSAYRRFLPILAVASILFLLAALAEAVPPALAQNSNPSDPGDVRTPAPQSGSQPGAQQSDSQQPSETLKVNVNVVGVFFNVKDKHGALIPNQTKDDFEVFEDGKPQTIKYFAANSDLPLTLGILIDSSGSQLRVLDMEKEVGGAFLKHLEAEYV